jgi:hypothetical protein
MNEKPPSELRGLAKDYATGRLTLDDYRQRRTQLIDDITSGARSVANAAHDALVNDDTLPAFPTSDGFAATAPKPRLLSRGLLLGALLVCAIAAALFLAL